MPSVVFVSNYYTHHQSEFSEEMYKLCSKEYVFIETEEMPDERTSMGWEIEKPEFVKTKQYAEQNKNVVEELINSSDVVIIGSAPISMVHKRLKAGKLTFLYSERIYKKGCRIYKLPVHILKLYRKFGRHKSLYLLCSSAFAAYDYSRALCFKNKAYKWGYFPLLKKYDDIAAKINEKQLGSLLWVARLIDWKHPETPVLIAKRLKADGYKFALNIIGNGEMEEKIKEMIEEYDLCDCVNMLGAMSPEEVRSYMEKSSIFLFTSDQNEGWGAVLNEAMNSGCAVVASSAIGAVPFLIENEKNGMIYQNGNFEDVYNQVKNLLDNKKLCRDLGKEAYQTIHDLWNAEVAAERLLVLNEQLGKNGKSNMFDNGPCSKADILKDGWYGCEKIYGGVICNDID